jgi:gas vesicle protein
MADEDRGSSGFLWGVLLGGVAGFFLGSYLATEQGRQRVSQLRQRAEELANDPELRQRAQDAIGAARDAFGDAVKQGATAARERREELEHGDATSITPAADQAGRMAATEAGRDG